MVEAIKDVVDICAGSEQFFCRTREMLVFGWGDNSEHTLGIESEFPFVSTPTVVPSLQKTRVRLLSSSNNFSLALMGDHLAVWGKTPFSESPYRIPKRIELEGREIASVGIHTNAIILLLKSGELMHLSNIREGWENFPKKAQSMVVAGEIIFIYSEANLVKIKMEEGDWKYFEDEKEVNFKNEEWNFAFSGERLKKRKKSLNDQQIKEMSLDFINQRDDKGRTVVHYGEFCLSVFF